MDATNKISCWWIWSLFIICHFFITSELAAQFKGDFSIQRHYLDMENFLDWKAYQQPIPWQLEWDRTDTGLLASVGSISMYEFYTYNEIRLTKELGKWATFYYQQMEESFYKKEPLYQKIEFRFGSDYGISIIGFPPYDKKYGDFGYVLSYGKRYRGDYLRISRLSQDFKFNDKNANSDKNVRDESYLSIPIQHRLEFRYTISSHLQVTLDAKQISKAEFETESPRNLQTFEGNETRFRLLWHLGLKRMIGLTGYQIDEHRKQIPESPTATLPNLQQQLGLKWLDGFYHGPFMDSGLITAGILQSTFNNYIDSITPINRYDCDLQTLQAYFFWQYPKSQWFHWLFSFQAGQVILKKDYIGIEEDEDGSSVELKAGVGIIMQEEENYRLLCNTTWDLDIFQTRQWDGGNIQLQLKF